MKIVRMAFNTRRIPISIVDDSDTGTSAIVVDDRDAERARALLRYVRRHDAFLNNELQCSGYYLYDDTSDDIPVADRVWPETGFEASDHFLVVEDESSSEEAPATSPEPVPRSGHGDANPVVSHRRSCIAIIVLLVVIAVVAVVAYHGTSLIGPRP